MSVMRLYRCNLCGSSKDLNQLLGLWWTTLAVSGEVLVVKPARDVENHVCLECLRSLQAIKLPDCDGEAPQ